MRNVIMIGCDLHDESMLLKVAEGRQTPETLVVKNTARGREGMIANLKQRAKAAGNARLVFAYEASGQGFGLYDQLTAAGIGCKGHITHQGSSRVRKVLCQATWARIRYDDREKTAYERLRARNPRQKKIAVVASMRRLAIRMWHLGCFHSQEPAAIGG